MMYNNSYYSLGKASSTGDPVTAKYQIGDSFIVSYNHSKAGTLTWSDLVTIEAKYDPATKSITCSIVDHNESYKDAMYGDKRLTVDPSVPTIIQIAP